MIWFKSSCSEFNLLDRFKILKDSRYWLNLIKYFRLLTWNLEFKNILITLIGILQAKFLIIVDKWKSEKKLCKNSIVAKADLVSFNALRINNPSSTSIL